MKPILLITTLICALTTVAFADTAPTVNSSVVFNFDTSRIEKLGTIKELTTHFTGHYVGQPGFLSASADLTKNKKVEFNTNGVTVDMHELTAGTLVSSKHDYLLSNIHTQGDSFSDPTQPLCSLTNTYRPGNYQVIFDTEPLYYEPSNGAKEFMGYWLTCQVQKS